MSDDVYVEYIDQGCPGDEGHRLWYLRPDPDTEDKWEWGTIEGYHIFNVYGDHLTRADALRGIFDEIGEYGCINCGTPIHLDEEGDWYHATESPYDSLCWWGVLDPEPQMASGHVSV